MSKTNDGIVRKLDELGRIALPMEMRKSLKLEERAEVSITVNDGEISIIPTQCRCKLCGGNENLETVAGVTICKDCIAKVINYSEREGK